MAVYEVTLSGHDFFLSIRFLYNRPPESSTGQAVVVCDENSKVLEPGSKFRSHLKEIITGANKQPLPLPRLYPMYVKLPGKGKASHVTALLTGTV